MVDLSSSLCKRWPGRINHHIFPYMSSHSISIFLSLFPWFPMVKTHLRSATPSAIGFPWAVGPASRCFRSAKWWRQPRTRPIWNWLTAVDGFGSPRGFFPIFFGRVLTCFHTERIEVANFRRGFTRVIQISVISPTKLGIYPLVMTKIANWKTTIFNGKTPL